MPFGNLGTVWAEVGLRYTQFDAGREHVARGTRDLARNIDQHTQTMGRHWQRMGQDVQRMARTATLAFAGVQAGLAALSLASMRTYTDFERSMRNVASVANATEAQFERLTLAARRAGREMVFSASQAADALYFLASAGFSVDQQIDALQGTLELAAATQSDLASTSAAVAAAISQFGLAAEDATRVANTYAAAISSSQANMDKLATSMAYVGPVAGSLGMDIEQTTSALTALYNAGIDGSTAGTSLRETLVSLMTPTTKVTEILGQLGLTTRDINPDVHSLADIVDTLAASGMTTAQTMEMFGARAGVAMQVLTRTGGDALREMETSIRGTDAASRMAEQQMDSYAGTVAQFRSFVEDLRITIGELLAQAWRPMIELILQNSDQIQRTAVAVFTRLAFVLTTVVDAARAVIDWWHGLSDSARATAQNIVLFGGAVMGTVGALSLMAMAVKVLGPAIAVLSGVFTILTSPIILAILGIVAALATLVVAWEQDWGNIRALTEDVVGKILGVWDQLSVWWDESDLGGLVRDAWEQLVDIWHSDELTLGEKVLEGVKVGIKAVADVVSVVWEAGKDLAQRGWDWLLDQAGIEYEDGKARSTLGDIRLLLNAVWGWVERGVEALRRWWSGEEKEIGEEVKRIGGFRDKLLGTIELVVEWLRDIGDTISKWWRGGEREIDGELVHIDGFRKKLSGLVDLVFELARRARDVIRDWWSGPEKEIEDEFRRVGGMSRTLRLWAEIAWNAVKSAYQALVDWFTPQEIEVEGEIHRISQARRTLDLALEAVWGWVRSAVDVLREWWAGERVLIEDETSLLGKAERKIRQGARAVWGWVEDGVTALRTWWDAQVIRFVAAFGSFEAATNTINQWVSVVWGFAQDAWSALLTWWRDSGQPEIDANLERTTAGARHEIKRAIHIAWGWAVDTWDRLRAFVSRWWHGDEGEGLPAGFQMDGDTVVITDAQLGMKARILGGITAVWEWALDIYDTIVNWWHGVPASVKDGTYEVEGFGATIRGTVTATWRLAVGLYASIVDWWERTKPNIRFHDNEDTPVRLLDLISWVAGRLRVAWELAESSDLIRRSAGALISTALLGGVAITMLVSSLKWAGLVKSMVHAGLVAALKALGMTAAVVGGVATFSLVGLGITLVASMLYLMLDDEGRAMVRKRIEELIQSIHEIWDDDELGLIERTLRVALEFIIEVPQIVRALADAIADQFSGPGLSPGQRELWGGLGEDARGLPGQAWGWVRDKLRFGPRTPEEDTAPDTDAFNDALDDTQGRLEDLGERITFASEAMERHAGSWAMAGATDAAMFGGPQQRLGRPSLREQQSVVRTIELVSAQQQTVERVVDSLVTQQQTIDRLWAAKEAQWSAEIAPQQSTPRPRRFMDRITFGPGRAQQVTDPMELTAVVWEEIERTVAALEEVAEIVPKARALILRALADVLDEPGISPDIREAVDRVLVDVSDLVGDIIEIRRRAYGELVDIAAEEVLPGRRPARMRRHVLTGLTPPYPAPEAHPYAHDRAAVDAFVDAVVEATARVERGLVSVDRIGPVPTPGPRREPVAPVGWYPDVQGAREEMRAAVDAFVDVIVEATARVERGLASVDRIGPVPTPGDPRRREPVTPVGWYPDVQGAREEMRAAVDAFVDVIVEAAARVERGLAPVDRIGPVPTPGDSRGREPVTPGGWYPDVQGAREEMRAAVERRLIQECEAAVALLEGAMETRRAATDEMEVVAEAADKALENITTYAVVAGDTLSKIAQRLGTTVAVLMELNEAIADPDVIYVGQRLAVPGTAGIPERILDGADAIGDALISSGEAVGMAGKVIEEACEVFMTAVAELGTASDQQGELVKNVQTRLDDRAEALGIATVSIQRLITTIAGMESKLGIPRYTWYPGATPPEDGWEVHPGSQHGEGHMIYPVLSGWLEKTWAGRFGGQIDWTAAENRVSAMVLWIEEAIEDEWDVIEDAIKKFGITMEEAVHLWWAGGGPALGNVVAEGLSATITQGMDGTGVSADSLLLRLRKETPDFLRTIAPFVGDTDWLTIGKEGGAQWLEGFVAMAGEASREARRLADTISAELERISLPVMARTDIGGRVFAQTGTILAGYGGGDRIPAMLEAGEAVIPKEAVSRYRGLVEALIDGAPIAGFQRGGIVGVGPDDPLRWQMDLLHEQVEEQKAFWDGLLDGFDQFFRVLMSGLETVFEVTLDLISSLVSMVLGDEAAEAFRGAVDSAVASLKRFMDALRQGPVIEEAHVYMDAQPRFQELHERFSPFQPEPEPYPDPGLRVLSQDAQELIHWLERMNDFMGDARKRVIEFYDAVSTDAVTVITMASYLQDLGSSTEDALDKLEQFYSTASSGTIWLAEHMALLADQFQSSLASMLRGATTFEDMLRGIWASIVQHAAERLAGDLRVVMDDLWEGIIAGSANLGQAWSGMWGAIKANTGSVVTILLNEVLSFFTATSQAMARLREEAKQHQENTERDFERFQRLMEAGFTGEWETETLVLEERVRFFFGLFSRLVRHEVEVTSEAMREWLQEMEALLGAIHGIARSALSAALQGDDTEGAFLERLREGIYQHALDGLIRAFAEGAMIEQALAPIFQALHALFEGVWDTDEPMDLGEWEQEFADLADDLESHLEDVAPWLEHFAAIMEIIRRGIGIEAPDMDLSRLAAQLESSATGALSDAFRSAEGDAYDVFLESLNRGIYENVLRGLIDAFTESQVYRDIMAPLLDGFGELMEGVTVDGVVDLDALAEGLAGLLDGWSEGLEDLEGPLAAIVEFLRGLAGDLLPPEVVAEATSAFEDGLRRAMETGLAEAWRAADGQEYETFLESVNRGLYNQVLSAIVTAFAESAVYRDLLDPIVDDLAALFDGLELGDPMDLDELWGSLDDILVRWRDGTEELEGPLQVVAEFLRLMGLEILPPIEEVEEWAQQVTSIASSAMRAAFDAEGDEFAVFYEHLRGGIYSHVRDGLIAAFVESAMFQRVMDPLFRAIDEAFEASIETIGDSFVFSADVFAGLMEGILDEWEDDLGEIQSVFEAIIAMFRDLEERPPRWEVPTPPEPDVPPPDYYTTLEQSVAAALRSAIEAGAEEAWPTFHEQLGQALYDTIISNMTSAFGDSWIIQRALAPVFAELDRAFSDQQFLPGFEDRLQHAFEYAMRMLQENMPGLEAYVEGLAEFAEMMRELLGLDAEAAAAADSWYQQIRSAGSRALRDVFGAARGEEFAVFLESLRRGVADHVMDGLITAFIESQAYQAVMGPLYESISEALEQAFDDTSGGLTFDLDLFELLITDALENWEEGLGGLGDVLQALRLVMLNLREQLGLDDIEVEHNIRGVQITRMTGRDRDLFVELLRPIGVLDRLPQILYEMLGTPEIDTAYQTYHNASIDSIQASEIIIENVNLYAGDIHVHAAAGVDAGALVEDVARRAVAIARGQGW